MKVYPMSEERRNDIGFKATLTIFTSVIAILLGLFVNVVWNTANEGTALGYRNEAKVIRVEARLDAIQNDLQEIKTLLRRNIPRGD